MDDLPENWVDKIFELMNKFYGERWQKQFKSAFEIDLYKTVWFNGLNTLTHAQIKHGLAISKKYSEFSRNKPPHIVVFFHFCVGIRVPEVSRRT